MNEFDLQELKAEAVTVLRDLLHSEKVEDAVRIEAARAILEYVWNNEDEDEEESWPSASDN